MYTCKTLTTQLYVDSQRRLWSEDGVFCEDSEPRHCEGHRDRQPVPAHETLPVLWRGEQGANTGRCSAGFQTIPRLHLCEYAIVFIQGIWESPTICKKRRQGGHVHCIYTCLHVHVHVY